MAIHVPFGAPMYGVPPITLAVAFMQVDSCPFLMQIKNGLGSGALCAVPEDTRGSQPSQREGGACWSAFYRGMDN